MKARSRYSDKKRFSIETPGKSMTQQALANESDINKIMAKAIRTGQPPPSVHERQAQFGDFTQITSFHQAQTALVHAQNEFNTLPAKIRSYFDNDPEKLIKFLDDPDNLEEAVQMGLVQPPPSEEEEPPPGDHEDLPPPHEEAPLPDTKAT